VEEEEEGEVPKALEPTPSSGRAPDTTAGLLGDLLEEKEEEEELDTWLAGELPLPEVVLAVLTMFGAEDGADADPAPEPGPENMRKRLLTPPDLAFLGCTGALTAARASVPALGALALVLPLVLVLALVLAELAAVLVIAPVVLLVSARGGSESTAVTAQATGGAEDAVAGSAGAEAAVVVVVVGISVEDVLAIAATLVVLSTSGVWRASATSTTLLEATVDTSPVVVFAVLDILLGAAAAALPW
jgi:hypothetical protein